jgi:hypothetical protein
MKLVFLVTALALGLHWFTSQPADEATVRTIITSTFLALVYGALQLIFRFLRRRART